MALYLITPTDGQLFQPRPKVVTFQWYGSWLMDFYFIHVWNKETQEDMIDNTGLTGLFIPSM